MWMVTHKASSDAEVGSTTSKRVEIRERIVSVKDLVLRKLSRVQPEHWIVVDQTTAGERHSIFRSRKC